MMRDRTVKGQVKRVGRLGLEPGTHGLKGGLGDYLDRPSPSEPYAEQRLRIRAGVRPVGFVCWRCCSRCCPISGSQIRSNGRTFQDRPEPATCLGRSSSPVGLDRWLAICLAAAGPVAAWG
jgi:hypothetical protein